MRRAKQIAWSEVMQRALAYRRPWRRMSYADALREAKRIDGHVVFASEPGEQLRRCHPRLRTIDLPEAADESAEVKGEA